MQTISFKATGLKSPAGSDIDADNIIKSNGVSLLKTVGLYGANASGKSNMLMALSYFTRAVSTLATDSRLIRPLYDPFLFETSNEGCFFQVVLLLNGKKYRYGYVVNKLDNASGNADSNGVKIESEWLYGNIDKNMKRLFLRVGNEVKENNLPTSEGMVIPTKLPYPHTLFLVHATAFDAKGIPEQIVSYLNHHIINNIVYKNVFRGVSINAIKKSTPLFLSFLKRFNMKYDGIELIDDESYADVKYFGFPSNKVLLKRTTHDGNNKPLSMNLEYRESAGNKKIFDLRGIRNDADFAKQYLAGYYGALPVLNDYTEAEENENGKQ